MYKRQDRDRQLVEYGAWNAQFLRVTHLMGFMDGLCAFAEEPDACRSLIEAITDYKIRLAESVAHYFKPDFFTSYEDVATQQSLFLSPQTDVYKRQKIDTVKLLEKCLEHNVAFVPGNSFFPNTKKRNTLRLNFSNMPEEKISDGIMRIGRALKEFTEK